MILFADPTGYRRADRYVIDEIPLRIARPWGRLCVTIKESLKNVGPSASLDPSARSGNRFRDHRRTSQGHRRPRFSFLHQQCQRARRRAACPVRNHIAGLHPPSGPVPVHATGDCLKSRKGHKRPPQRSEPCERGVICGERVGCQAAIAKKLSKTAPSIATSPRPRRNADKVDR